MKNKKLRKYLEILSQINPTTDFSDRDKYVYFASVIMDIKRSMDSNNPYEVQAYRKLANARRILLKADKHIQRAHKSTRTAKFKNGVYKQFWPNTLLALTKMQETAEFYTKN